MTIPQSLPDGVSSSAGIMVSAAAVKNATSVSALMLTTEALISEIPSAKAPAMQGGGGEGMY